MKRFFRLLVSTICAVMMFATLAFAAETSSEDGTATVRLDRREYETLYVKTDGGNLNVRSGPGTEYEIVGKLPNGTMIDFWSVFGEVDSTGRSWTSIRARDANGNTVSGWVADEYLTNVPPSRSIPVGIGPDVG